MELSAFPQWQIFLICLAFGLPAGALYDVFRFLRHAGLNSNLAVLLQDTAYMCLCAVWMFLISGAVNFGVVRVYMAAAFFAGAIIYRLSIGRLTGRVFELVVSLASRAYRRVKTAFKAVISFFCKQTTAIMLIFCSLHKNYRKKSKNSLQDKTTRVYNYKKHNSPATAKRRRGHERGSKRSRARKKAQ